MKKLQFTLYYVFFSILQAQNIFADVIEVNTKFESQNIGPHINYMIDRSLSFSYEDAKKNTKNGAYIRSLSDSKGFGVGRNSLWMFFDVRSIDNNVSKLYLISQIPLYEAILYYEQNGKIIEKKSGFKHPHTEWDISHNRVVFNLDLPSEGETRRFFIRIETDGVLAFDWIMANFKHTNLLITHEKFMLGAFLGLIIIMIFYNLFLFFSVREISYFYYIMYLLFFFMLTFGIDGLSFQYLWPDSVEWNLRSFTFFAALSSIFSTLFARSFLKIPKISKRVNWLSIFLVILFSIHWVLCIFLSIDANNERGNILGAVQLLSLVFFGAYSLARGQKQARFFLIAILFLSTGSICYILSNLNIIESTIFSKYGLHIGASLEILFFSLALADRINIEKKEKIFAQKEAIIAMKKSEKLKDEIMANTSHELLTPLTGITGISESLIEGSLGSLNKNIVNNLKIIMNSSKRLTSQVHDILDLSKIKNKKVNLNCKEILLNHIVNDCIALLSPLIKNRDIRIVNELDPKTVVFADHDRMYQIFNNLIGNAIKFTRKGEIKVTAQTKTNFVEIKVSDTGIGIEPSNQKRIFEPFEQADGSISRSYGGSGLGLATSKNLIELQNGSIWVQSEKGRGSDFVFTLPKGTGKSTLIYEENDTTHNLAISLASQNILTDSPENELIDSAENELIDSTPVIIGKNLLKSELKGAKILAVDDEPVNLQVIENIMHLEDVEIKLENDSTKVMDEVLSRWIPDIILLDVMMPELDGYELTRKIRKIYNESQLPIILLTAKNQINDLLEGFKAGANDYITKPFSRKEFMARINTQLELKALHNQLEQLVKSRTRELTKALKKQKDLQNQLVESEKMASLGGLVAGVAHEINTPLGVSITASTGIESETSSIKSIATKGLKRSQLESYFDEVSTSSLVLVKNLDRIRETIDKFKQLAVSFYSNKPQEVTLNRVLDDIKSLMESKYKEKIFSLVISCEQLQIFSYEHELQQVLTQLFENALAHNRSKNIVNIKIEVHKESSGQIVLIFEDDGEGIPADVIERIFEPFFTGKRLDGHIGLGLNLIYNLVAHKLQGSISCESEQNKFCRFIIKLPKDVCQELKYA